MPFQLKLIMVIDPPPDVLKTELPVRENAVEPGLHDAPSGPAHADHDADGAGVT
jgi:hypothetical protein